LKKKEEEEEEEEEEEVRKAKLSSETKFRPQAVRLGLLIYELPQTRHLDVDQYLLSRT